MDRSKTTLNRLIYRAGTPIGGRVSEFRQLKRDLERKEQLRKAGKHLVESFFGPVLDWIFGHGKDVLKDQKHPLN